MSISLADAERLEKIRECNAKFPNGRSGSDTWDETFLLRIIDELEKVACSQRGPHTKCLPVDMGVDIKKPSEIISNALTIFQTDMNGRFLGMELGARIAEKAGFDDVAFDIREQASRIFKSE